MKTAEEIIAIIKQTEAGYAAQDNVQAARIANVLRGLLGEIADEEPLLDKLRKKYTGAGK